MKAISPQLKQDVDTLLRVDTNLAYLSFASKYGLKIASQKTGLSTGERIKLSCLAYITLKLGKEVEPLLGQGLQVRMNADATVP